MTKRISATELSRNLSDILNRVRYRGEQFVVERNGEPVATISPVVAIPKVTWRTVVERLADLSSGDPLFANDLEAIQRDQPKVQLPEWLN